jgi:bifunctional DNA-binding transcriptional regulator/antitoxin component of YhaV-PrlF toxin-antitoxin module
VGSVPGIPSTHRAARLGSKSPFENGPLISVPNASAVKRTCAASSGASWVASDTLGVTGSASLMRLDSKGVLPYMDGWFQPEGQAMSTLTVTAKGQVTLRKDLLKHLGVNPGEKISVDKLPDGRVEMKAARATGKISDVFNFLKRKKRPSLSIEEINEIARRGWAGKR